MSETETFRPSANGTYNQHTIAGVPNYYAQVDEAVADDFSSYIGSEGTGDLISTFLIPDPSLVRGAIQSVKVYLRVINIGTGDTCTSYAAVLTGGGNYYGSGYKLPAKNTWYNHNYAWNTNPATGLPWTVDEIANLEIGWKSSGGYNERDCTQIYAVVTFLPLSGGGAQIIGLELL